MLHASWKTLIASWKSRFASWKFWFAGWNILIANWNCCIAGCKSRLANWKSWLAGWINRLASWKRRFANWKFWLAGIKFWFAFWKILIADWKCCIAGWKSGLAPSSPPLSFLFTFNRPWDTTHYPHYSTNIKFFPGGFTPRPPYLSFLFTFNRPGYTTHYCANTKFSSSPPLSFLFTFNRPWDTPHYCANTKFFLWALPPDPLIYPSCLHSIDYEITTHYFALRPPYLSFLFTFNRLWDYYSLQRKYKKFSWGLRPQTPLTILPVYNQLILRPLLTTLSPDPHIYPSFLHSIDYEITHYSTNIKNFLGGFVPKTP